MSIVVAEFTVSSDVFVLGQVLRNHEDVRVDLTQFVPLGDDRVAGVTKLNGCHGRHLYSIE